MRDSYQLRRHSGTIIPSRDGTDTSGGNRASRHGDATTIRTAAAGSPTGTFRTRQTPSRQPGTARHAGKRRAPRCFVLSPVDQHLRVASARANTMNDLRETSRENKRRPAADPEAPITQCYRSWIGPPRTDVPTMPAPAWPRFSCPRPALCARQSITTETQEGSVFRCGGATVAELTLQTVPRTRSCASLGPSQKGVGCIGAIFASAAVPAGQQDAVNGDDDAGRGGSAPVRSQGHHHDDRMARR